jgi:hypothetical protein
MSKISNSLRRILISLIVKGSYDSPYRTHNTILIKKSLFPDSPYPTDQKGLEDPKASTSDVGWGSLRFSRLIKEFFVIILAFLY